MRRRAKPAKAKAEARLPVAPKSRKNGAPTVRDLEKRLADALKREAEALEQQTATADILRVISGSPTDVGPVFATILDKVIALVGAQLGALWRYDGDELFRAVEHRGAGPELRTLLQEPQRFGRPFFRTSGPWKPAQILDVRETEPYRRRDPFWVNSVDQEGMRTLLNVPLVGGTRYLGSISLYRREVRAFTEKEISLLQTFADQAVIAIENVRLFNETKEALEQQTATAEILRVIASSPTDLGPVFGTIVHNATRICEGLFGAVYRYDGDRIHFVAHENFTRRGLELLERGFPSAPSRDSMIGRAILDASMIHVPDLEADEDVSAWSRQVGRSLNYRSLLVVPMLREGRPIGAIAVSRGQSAFTERQINVVRTFADQAVIAIENVRLFTELQQKNEALTDAHAQVSESLEQQTATAEILRVIASSPTDLQPVMDVIAENAARVCGATYASIFRQEGEHLRLVARHGSPRQGYLAIGDTIPVGHDTIAGRVVRGRRTIHVEDLMAAEAEFPITVSRSRQAGAHLRTILATPLLREGTPLGAIYIIRGPEVHPFSAKQIALLETFANQAVIAIENVRLFTELEGKNLALTKAHAQVTEALDQQTATADILRVIASSPTDVQPVFDAIAERAMHLCGASTGGV